MDKAYTRVNYENFPSHQTPVSATTLNIMDKGIDDLDDRIIALDGSKVDKYKDIPNPIDLNTLTETGFYFIHDSCTNIPSGANGGGKATVQVISTHVSSTNAYIVQIFYNQLQVDNVQQVYFRIGYGTIESPTFKSWQIMAVSSDLKDIAQGIGNMWDLGSYANTSLLYSLGFPTHMYPAAQQGSNAYALDVLSGTVYKNTRMGETSYTWVEQTTLSLKLTSETTVTTSTDSTPYLYRKSKAIGDREYLDYIEGGSLGCNSANISYSYEEQSGLTKAISSDGTGLKITGTVEDPPLYGIINLTSSMRFMRDGRKYLILISNAKNYSYGISGYSSVSVVNGGFMWSASSDSSWNGLVFLYGYNGLDVDIDNLHISVIDLSSNLGSTVADYVYSLEQATAGSGIAWLKEQGLFTDEDYAYDPGSIKSVNVSGHKMTGFNQWDEEREIGDIDTSGNPTSSQSNNQIRSKNFCSILPNTTYYGTCQKTDGGNDNKYYLYINYYDSNKDFIKKEAINRLTFITPSNAKYFKLNTNSGTVIYGNTYNHDICINISDTTKNGTYEPYEEHIYPITSTDLLGIPVLTSDNKLGFVGDRYNANGRVDRKYGIVDLGSLSWERPSYSDFYYFRNTTTIENIKNGVSNQIANIISPIYLTVKSALVNNNDFINNTMFLWTDGKIYLRNDTYSDAATFKTAMQNSNAQLVYELATPTTENATPIINPQICSPYGTEEFISDSHVPVPHGTEYYKTPDWMDVEPFKTERKNNDSNTQLLSVINSRTRQDITDRLSNLSQAVSEQNLEKYGYKIGDYFVGASGYNYILADYNTFKGTSTPYCLTTNHIGIVVDTKTTSQWYNGDASSVGYNGSTLNTNLKGTVLDNIKSDFIALFGGTTGLEHLLPHSKLLTTALANWGWQANQYISALSEVQAIGSVVWGANGYQTGEASKKLEVFDKYKWTEIFKGRYPWLRDLCDSSNACYLEGDGFVNRRSVGANYYAVGLINFY